MNHAQLLNAAKASRIPLPPPDHEKYDLVVRAQANAELMRREANRTAEQDLYFFCTSVLGYAEMYEPLHRPLCEFVSSEKKSSLTLIPRGHFKSTIISVSYPLWLLCKFPDTRILLANATLDNPRKWVQEQQTHLKENAVLRWMYPEMCPTDEDIQQFGYSWHYTVRNRSPGCPWGEASVEVCSIERNVVSRHYETIIYDDIVSEENSRSKIGLDRTEEFYKSSQALLQGEVEGESKWKVAPVHTRCVGTRWNYGDLWGLLIERGMPHLVRQAIEDNAAIFSTMFSVDRLNQIREEMGSSLFASQYMNDPIDADNAVFSRDHTAYYSTVNPKDLSISITVDLAIDEKESADDTAIVVTGVDDAGCIFVLDYSNGKYLPSKTVSEIYRLYEGM